MANVIDSLLITFGLDSREVGRGVQQVEGYITSALDTVNSFAAGVQEGLTENADGLHEVATAAESAGDALRKTGETGSGAMESVAAKTAQTETRMKSLSERAADLGKNIGGKLKGLLTGLAAPMAAMFAVTSLIGGYKSDLSELDALTKKTSLSMEERARKQKLLGSYTKEDLEQYRKSQKELEGFSKNIKEGAAIIMRLFMPALNWILGALGSLIGFIVRHRSFVIPLLAGIAAILTASMLPALKAMIPVIKAIGASTMKAMLPFLPWIALVTGLALLFDDLWTYVNGGESALSGLWSVFGTGEEISEFLAKAWKDLKSIGEALWSGVTWAAKSFFSYFGPAFRSLFNIVKSVLQLIKAIFIGDFTGMIDAFKNLWNSVGQFLVDVLSAPFLMLFDIVKSVFEGIGSFFTGLFNSIIGTVTGAIKSIVSKIPDFLLPENLSKWAKGLDEATSYAGLAVESANGYSALDGVSPYAMGGASTNTTENNTFGDITVYAQSNDAAGIAREVGAEQRRMVATGNKGVKQ